jgi:integrase
MPNIDMDAAFVRNAACLEGRHKTDWYDNAITGFILEVRSSGGKTYALRYRDPHGKLRQRKIGDAKSISFDKAKQEAIKLRSIVVLGGNPAEDRKVLRQVPTLAEVIEQRYLPEIKRTRRNFKSTLSFFNHHLLPRLGSYHLDQISSEMISQHHAELIESGISIAYANRMIVNLKTIYNLCKRWKVPGVDTNPAESLKVPNPNNIRERYLTQEELVRLRAALDQCSNPQLKHLVNLSLLLACRKRELLDARWEYVDFERRVLRVPLSKSGKARNIPLSAAAIAILKQLPRWKDCPWVIPNPETRKPYGNLHYPWAKVRAAAGLDDVRWHDLRHSAASALVQANVPIYTVARILGHSTVQHTARYSHLGDETLLAAMETAANALGQDWSQDKVAPA